MTCPKCGKRNCAMDPLGAYWCQEDLCGYVWFPHPWWEGKGWDRQGNGQAEPSMVEPDQKDTGSQAL